MVRRRRSPLTGGALAGYDVVIIDGKHGAGGRWLDLSLAQAAATGGEGCFVSVPSQDSRKRSPTQHDVPTIKDQGVEMVTKGYADLLSPAGTAPAMVQRLQAEVAIIVTLPEVREQLARVDYDPVGGTSKELATAIEDGIARYRNMVRGTKFKINC